jgi:hypothetical protein
VFIILAMILWVGWVEWSVGRVQLKTEVGNAQT